MRKTQKAQTEEFVKLLAEAQQEIKLDIENGSVAEALDLLGQCQQGAIELATLIETLEGEDFVTVGLLEKYCEAVFEIYQALEQGNKVDTEAVYGLLEGQLAQVEESIERDIKVRKEVVFLPYKASMWDSLESVWKAADADPDCDAYVIPIPYYDKNPDGSFKEEHYEGDQYPEYVPITRYDAYDFAGRRPDKIFIHNPYDEHNYVTSVHPFFYSSNLKQFTEELVYIPYFVLAEIDPENEAAVEGISHFVTVPGVVYAHKVIVQSEAMRQAYIKVMCKHTGEEQREYWEEKILGLGSPKLDKVLNTLKEDLKIPDKWLQIIQKPDGSWKKIIFYNTTVTAFLEHNEQMLTKIRDVLRVFEENKEDVALLWRPHPLMKSTIESLRPHLWEEYSAIVEQYKAEGWGIYDDTADLDRAVAICDGYYGDPSSVVQLCKAAGKPVMVQNVWAIQANIFSLAMDNIVEYKDERWFVGLKDNVIYRMSKMKFKANLVTQLPWDGTNSEPQYGKLLICDNKAFAIPWSANKIAVYDIVLGQTHYLNYVQESVFRGRIFSDAIVHDNKLYLLPSAYECILCIDIDTEVITYIRLDEVLQACGEKHMYAWGSVYYDENVLCMTMLSSNKIIVYHFENSKIEIYECEYLINGGAGICGNKEKIWVIPYTTDKIICWNRATRTSTIIDKFPAGYLPGEYISFHKMVLEDKKIFLLPRAANMCIALDVQTSQLEQVFEKKEDVSTGFFEKYMRFSTVWTCNEETCFIQARTGDVFCVEQTKDYQSVLRKEKIQFIDGDKASNMQLDWELERENRFENVENYIRHVKRIQDISCEEAEIMGRGKS